MNAHSYEPWPSLSYEKFKSTAHLLHMTTQILGKFKLHSPFEPHWSNVPLWITSRGLTTGPIPYQNGIFSFEIDLIAHQIIATSSFGARGKFHLTSMSVTQLTKKIFSLLEKLQIELQINLLPQEIPNPIPFNKDTEKQIYQPDLANAWWRILVSSYRVMKRYHAHFNGETPPIGLMWGTFDLRDARYNGIAVPTTGINSGYIRRNAMDEAQIEIGWWHGNDNYPQPAYYSFTYPQPENIEQAVIEPKTARFEKSLGEFILDYENVRNSSNPEKNLLCFFESTYQAGAKYAHWNPKFITAGEPI